MIGLGFLQYSNDDVVMPELIANGCAPEDARAYTVAARREFCIPGRGMEWTQAGEMFSSRLAASHDVKERGLPADADQHAES